MGLWLGEKTHFKKKISIGFCRVAWVTGQPNGSAEFLLIPVF